MCAASVSSFKALPGNPIHKRELSYQSEQIIVNDMIEGDGMHLAESFIHLHPDVKIINVTENLLKCMLAKSVFSIKAVKGLTFDIEKGWFSSEFGLKTENVVLVLRKRAMTPFSFGYTIFL